VAQGDRLAKSKESLRRAEAVYAFKAEAFALSSLKHSARLLVIEALGTLRMCRLLGEHSGSTVMRARYHLDRLLIC
jgi:hypothetical protein